MIPFFAVERGAGRKGGVIYFTSVGLCWYSGFLWTGAIQELFTHTHTQHEYTCEFVMGHKKEVVSGI